MLKPKPAKPGPARAAEAKRFFKPPGASRQIGFHQLLVAARQKYFMDALSAALGTLDQDKVKSQLAHFLPADVQKLLAAAGLRDEYVFPVPAVIEAKPTLIGYYRLLLGAPQKSFYKGSTGMGLFKSMEEMGTMSAKQKVYVPDFCMAIAQPLADLVRQIPSFTERDLRELPLLTFGSQLQGANNTRSARKQCRKSLLRLPRFWTSLLQRKNPTGSL